MRVDDIVDFLNVVEDIALICLIATKDAYQKISTIFTIAMGP
jgi:hypothetical protein